jgi:uncharacterized 2Fe-2S/4Fe-4S cluster protein (DUF4445 family)
MTKITVTQSDINNANKALSHLAAARGWKAILDAAGVPTDAEEQILQANEKIATVILQALVDAQKETL